MANDDVDMNALVTLAVPRWATGIIFAALEELAETLDTARRVEPVASAVDLRDLANAIRPLTGLK